jgi:hypothetical protein
MVLGCLNLHLLPSMCPYQPLSLFQCQCLCPAKTPASKQALQGRWACQEGTPQVTLCCPLDIEVPGQVAAGPQAGQLAVWVMAVKEGTQVQQEASSLGTAWLLRESMHHSLPRRTACVVRFLLLALTLPTAVWVVLAIRGLYLRSM